MGAVRTRGADVRRSAYCVDRGDLLDEVAELAPLTVDALGHDIFGSVMLAQTIERGRIMPSQ
jgi:hypothetical protein